MTLPNFLGLGAQRSGSTWLHNQLIKHPDIYLPKKKKEVHFFDRYYDRGVKWYKNFFKDGYTSTGEITPMYLYDSDTPSKIHKLIPDCKFIVILRNPVNRAFSQYQLAVRDNNENRGFEEYFSQVPDVYRRGMYTEQLQRYFELFDKNQFLILIFEEVMKEQHKSLCNIGEFLGVDINKFDMTRINEKVNESYHVKHSRLYAKFRKFGAILRENDMDVVVNIAKQLNVKKLFGRNNDNNYSLSVELKKELFSHYESDIKKLELLLGRNLDVWKANY